MPISWAFYCSYCVVVLTIAKPSAVSSSELSGEGLTLLQLESQTLRSHVVNPSVAEPLTAGRATMMAGIEGTGHHLWWEIFYACKISGSCEMIHDLKCFSPIKNSDCACGDMDCANVSFSSSWAKLSLGADPRLGFVDLGSYPWGSSGCCMPNLIPVYQAAQESKDRLKVIILLRSVRSLLWSVHERFEHGADVEIEGARVLKEQLQQVHPEDRICVEYEALPEMASAMDNLLGSYAGSKGRHFDWKKEFDAKWNATQAARSDDMCTGENAAICESPELEAAMADLRALCGSSPHLVPSASDAGGAALDSNRDWTPMEVLQAIFDNRALVQ